MKGKYDGVNPIEKLKDGEPYFFLRAQDRLAPTTVMYYAELLERSGDTKGSQECIAFSQSMLEWQDAHPEHVKMPD